MINIEVIFIFIILVEFAYCQQDACNIAPEFDMCPGYSIWFWFDGEQCREFVGCEKKRNANHFPTFDQCHTQCLIPEALANVPANKGVCNIAPEFAWCISYGFWFWFNGDECIKFEGCAQKRNANHFKTIEECQRICL